jgi:hypothetical protein
MNNVSVVLREEMRVLSIAHSHLFMGDTIRKIYQMYGLTTTAQKCLEDFNREPKCRNRPNTGSSIVNHMYSLDPPTKVSTHSDTERETQQAVQTLMSFGDYPFTSHDDSETENAVDMLMALSKHR